ncbi:MAG: hypothetical protein CVT82_00280 [Alphaproteobacteria bacterium HGW-Alphaproteobacteria-4]|nr:MAG: hypothetical protein CVT82_00280 [Alphaproteobacteria bacterium HGW-Alphaproteobacteria-4]
MEWKNPTYNAVGTIDIDLNHPSFGWIPFTVSPDDTGAAFDVKALHYEILAGDIAPFVPPPAPTPPPLDEVKSRAISAMLAWAGDFMGRFTADTPLDERLSWDAKEAAARAHIAGTADAAQVELLQAEAALTGETVDNLSLLILANAELFRQIVGRVSGLRRVTRDAINAAETPEAVQAVLDVAKAQALAMAAALGIAP